MTTILGVLTSIWEYVQWVGNFYHGVWSYFWDFCTSLWGWVIKSAIAFIQTALIEGYNLVIDAVLGEDWRITVNGFVSSGVTYLSDSNVWGTINAWFPLNIAISAWCGLWIIRIAWMITLKVLELTKSLAMAGGKPPV